MVQHSPPLPSDAELATGLPMALSQTVDSLKLLDRLINDYSSSHPSEVVVCEIDGVERRLLVKYGSRRDLRAVGGRGGVEYEANVYGRLLKPNSVPCPTFFGVLDNPETGVTWLVLEYIDGSDRADNFRTGIVPAAAWLGRFHADAEKNWSSESTSFLRVYDHQYYSQWAKGAAKRVAPLKADYPWISELIEFFDELVSDFTVPPRGVIHGEFYPHNVLIRNGDIYPIDWESAAIGFSEIDLVSITDGWDPKTVKDSIAAYKRARWGGGSPPGFDEAFTSAHMYWNLRWLSGSGPYRDPFAPATIKTLPVRLRRLKAHYDQLYPTNR